VKGEIEFTDNCAVEIRCDKLEAGRLFPGTDSSEYELQFLEKGTMYYADENSKAPNTTTKVKGKPPHPLADMFFLSDDNELVLIDITAGGSDIVAKKVTNLAAWIEKEQNKLRDEYKYKLRGVVLAPNALDDSSYDKLTGVSIVCGSKAESLLGGLAQISQWLLD
jgi:hypothetical protein